MFSPSIQTIISLKLNPLELLPAGGSFQGAIERDASQGLVLVAGKTRVPLPDNAGLAPGQRVTAEPMRTPQGMQLRLTLMDSPTSAPNAPQPAPAPQSQQSQTPAQVAARASTPPPPAAATATPSAPPVPNPVQATPVTALFNSLLEMLASGTHPAAARPLAGLAQLRGLLTQAGDLRASLTEVLTLLDRAVAAGVEVKQSLEPLRQLITALTGNTDDFEALLRQAAERAGKSAESLAARLLTGGDPDEAAAFVRQDARAVLSQLREDPALRAFLKKDGSLESFTSKAGAVVERLSAENLQNLKGNEQAYRFFELPATPALGLFRAQFHVMGEPGKRRYAEDGGGASIAFDLGLSNLGDLWIYLRTVGPTCTCRFMAASPEAVDALAEESGHLATALETAGFRAAAVTVEPWDGNRIREIVAILRPPGPLDISA